MSRCFDRVEELQQLLWRVFQRINLHTRKFLSKQGLTMARFIVLQDVNENYPTTMGDIQKRLGMAPATLTGLVDGLVEAGLVNRWREESDRRSVYLAPNPEGQELCRRVFKYRAFILEEAVAHGDGLNLDDLNENLVALLNGLNVIRAEGKGQEGANLEAPCYGRDRLGKKRRG
ncbi:MAG: MarR family transcriptional regulator [Syntrophothermus sp.]|uniref:MarR family winged helix-turn-helix transcriptional regulator n=1 Tax=Syntrophothermus sp. TaxID=2736299 RepID=UPI00257EFB33|nr:MarR family transcriptional regulator [Syntrophothermus sp.]NSW81930.1 MarR family transcriptional regulator [Syntrophothermus sp.]